MTHPAEKDAPCGHGHLTAEAARDCAEWAAAYRVIPPGQTEPRVSTPGDNPGEGAG